MVSLTLFLGLAVFSLFLNQFGFMNAIDHCGVSLYVYLWAQIHPDDG
jgi:hypothetical protein